MRSTAIFASMAFLVMMLGVSLYGWLTIPADTMIARHWNANGEADGFSPRSHVLFAMPILGLFITVVFAVIPKIDPRQAHVKLSNGILLTGWIGSLALLTIIHCAIIFQSTGGDMTMPAPGLILYSACLFLIVLGNFIAKTKSNFFLGIRTPWTLSSEHAWSVANRTAGWLFVATGFTGALTGYLFGPETGFIIYTVGTLSAVLISIVVSYFAWWADPEREQL